jgi:hypothetical protein
MSEKSGEVRKRETARKSSGNDQLLSQHEVLNRPGETSVCLYLTRVKPGSLAWLVLLQRKAQ